MSSRPHRFRRSRPSEAISLSLALLLVLLPVAGCGPGEEAAGDGEIAQALEAEGPVDRDLAAIQERGRLVMLTTTNSTSYFVYRGALMGFEFGMLWAFARDLGVELDVKLVESPSEAYEKLNSGVGDVIAAQITPNGDLEGRVAFTDPLYESAPALIQRKTAPQRADFPEPVDRVLEGDAAPEQMTVRARLITRPSELSGRTVWVPEESATVERLVEIRDRVSGDIEIVELDEGFEELVRQVADGEIRLTAGPKNIAELKQAYFTNLIVEPTLGPPIETVWAVRKNAPNLLAALDDWLETERGGARYDQLYEKYFVDREAFIERTKSGFLTNETSRLSEYDALLEEAAGEIDWDWRLLASQTYQESRFKPRARSWAGAMGLLQLMPRTARQFGVTSPYDPQQNVAGAVRFLAWLENYWAPKIPDDAERLKFVLASYNAGQGHVGDARRLATKYGDDQNSWTDVSYWLMQKSKRQFYLDPVVYYGYCRGLEPVTYVAFILERYRHYQQLVPEQVPGTSGEAVAGLNRPSTPRPSGPAPASTRTTRERPRAAALRAAPGASPAPPA